MWPKGLRREANGLGERGWWGTDLRVRGIKRIHLLAQVQLLDPVEQIPLHARPSHTTAQLFSPRHLTLTTPKRAHKPKRRVPRRRRRRRPLRPHPILLHVLRRAQNPEYIAHAVDRGTAVDLPAEEKDNIPSHIIQRCDVQQVPERLAALLVVEQQLDALVAPVERVLDPLHALPVGVPPLQEAAVARDDVGAGVAGHFDEAVRGINDGIVGLGRVGEDEAVAQPGVAAAVRREGFGGG